jgi:hypothetical protein
VPAIKKKTDQEMDRYISIELTILSVPTPIRDPLNRQFQIHYHHYQMQIQQAHHPLLQQLVLISAFR